jgi:two-component system response regulator MprA
MIAVVEDDTSIREFLIDVLEDAGYFVVGFADGTTALSEIRKSDRRPNLILLDLMMPRMNGWEFRRVQQEDSLLASVPVVLLTARTDVTYQGQQLCANDYLRKPIDIDQLLDIAQRYSSVVSNS